MDPTVETRDRRDTETNIDLTCRGIDSFQDCIFFHTPVVGLGVDMVPGPERTAWFKKYAKKCVYIPCRALSLVQPGRGKIILPKGNEDIEKLWNFYMQALKLNANQVIWFDHEEENSMEYDLINDAAACATIREIVSGCEIGDARRKLFIFCNRPEIMPWAEEMGLDVVYDTKEWRDLYGHKSILHPGVDDEQSVVQSLMPPGVTIPVPRGFRCSTSDELVRAVAKLRVAAGEPIVDVCLKPVGASDGDGIEFVALSNDEKFASYAFPMGEIVVEEKLNLDKNSDGSLMTVVTHFCQGNLLGPSCDQLVGNEVSETAFIGNVYPSICPRPERKKCEEAVLAIMKATNPQGPGGFDFLFQNGQPYMVDVNGGRFNGGMYPKAFHKQFAARKTAYVSFKHYHARVSLDEVNTVLKENGWEFTPILSNDENSGDGQRGIFPMVHLPGVLGSYIAIAPTREECLSLMDAFMALAL